MKDINAQCAERKAQRAAGKVRCKRREGLSDEARRRQFTPSSAIILSSMAQGAACPMAYQLIGERCCARPWGILRQPKGKRIKGA